MSTTARNPRNDAAFCLSHTTGGRIKENAHNLRSFYHMVAERGGYGFSMLTSWTFKSPAADRKLGDQLVAKGLLVKVGSTGYKLAPEQREYFDSLVEGFRNKQQQS